MRLTILIIVLFTSIWSLSSQDRILFDLDSYKRVNIDFRTTTFSPDFSLWYDNQLNNASRVKSYAIEVGGRYNNSHLINSEKKQKSKSHSLELDFFSGTRQRVKFDYTISNVNRSYNELKYFKSGFRVRTVASYYKDQNSFASYDQFLDAKYDIGFGFGRLEVINNAWLGARILEELDIKDLLISMPDSEDMKLFFDLIGDLEYDRVFDFRLKNIYVVENIIEFVQAKGWVEKGSIKAFLSIYDTFRYEDYFTRFSGERLEFTLTPNVVGFYKWTSNALNSKGSYIQPGFEGNIEYQIHKNGDLEYYTTKILGGRIAHFDRFEREFDQAKRTTSADLYFQYEYRYLPSLRTNLVLQASFFGGFIYSDMYDANISIQSSLAYNYYFSPSTQLVIQGSVNYNDNRFQLGDYQPQITGLFSFDIVHAIR